MRAREKEEGLKTEMRVVRGMGKSSAVGVEVKRDIAVENLWRRER